MEEKLYELLEENGKVINWDRVNIAFNKHSIDIQEIDEVDGGLYGEKYYSAYDAYDRLEIMSALEDEE